MTDIRIITASFFLILIVEAVTVHTQQKAFVGDDLNWVRFESPVHDFSVSLPESGFLVDNGDGIYRLHYVSDQVEIRIDMDPSNRAKDDFKLSYYFEEETRYSLVKTGDFLIGQFIGKNKKNEPNELWLHLASSKASYLIKARTRDAANMTFRRFIDSIRLNNQTLYTPLRQYSPELRTILVSSLNSDTAVLEALRKADPKQNKLEKSTNVSDEKEDDNVGYSRPLVILRKPRVNVNSAMGRVISGTVKVRITFSANGEVGSILLLKSLDPALDRNAFEAAKRIKFLPAQKDGKSVDVTKDLTYSFLVQ